MFVEFSCENKFNGHQRLAKENECRSYNELLSKELKFVFIFRIGNNNKYIKFSFGMQADIYNSNMFVKKIFFYSSLKQD